MKVIVLIDMPRCYDKETLHDTTMFNIGSGAKKAPQWHNGKVAGMVAWFCPYTWNELKTETV